MIKMNRRDALKILSSCALSGGSGLWKPLFADVLPDLVAVRGGRPDVMFDRGIEALGGIGRFVKHGQTVVVKPNIGWDKSAEFAANTNPLLVRRIVEHCYLAGAKRVYVFDNAVSNWQRAYQNSGIAPMAKSAGAVIAPGNSAGYYQRVTIPGAAKLASTDIHELILSSDVVINVPVLKHHSSTGYTVAMKNLMGVVWNRYFFHMSDLHQCIADLALSVKPALNVIDAYVVTMANGPQQASKSDLSLKQMQILTTDIIAGDSAAIKIMGGAPEQVGFVTIGERAGLGTSDLSRKVIRKIAL